ncbi:MAG: hypothetical protein ACXVX6_04110 [Mycobacterium sp.]
MAAVTALTASPQPAPEKHDFVQAAMVTDLPGEIMSALQSSLSQFGIVVPNIPSGILGPATSPTSSSMTMPGALTATPGGLSAPGLAATAPALSATPSPGLTTTAPGLTAPMTPAIKSPPSVLNDLSLANPGLTPGTATLPAPSATASLPGATASLPGATASLPGLSTPQAVVDPALTSPLGPTSGLTGVPGEVPITAPTGPDGLPGYPVADSMLAMPSMPSTTPPASGGLLSELTSAADNLGLSQAMDLLKGVVVPSITQAIKSAAPAAAAVPVGTPPAQ